MAGAGLKGSLPALQHRDFRALWIGSACSSISLWTLLLGNAWIVYHLSNSSFWVGISTFASMSPFLLSPLGGVVADRFERRILVQVTRLGALTTTSALFVLALTGVIEVWMVVGIAMVQGLVRAVEIPGDQSLLPNVVAPGHVANAVALTSTTQHGARAVGPLLAGPMLATGGVEGAYLVAAIFAFLAWSSVRRVQTSSRGGIQRLGQVAENLREGFGYVRRTPPVLAVFLLVVAHCALTMSFDAMLPGFASDHLHSPSNGLTVMVFGVGMGALVGTLMLSFYPAKQRGRYFLITALGSGLTPVAMWASSNLASAAVSATLMGSSQAMFMALSAVLLQEVVPDAVRGRVMSLYLMSGGGIMAIANLGYGSLADAVGAPVLFLIPGLIFVVIVLLTWGRENHLRRLYRTGRVVQVAAPA